MIRYTYCIFYKKCWWLPLNFFTSSMIIPLKTMEWIWTMKLQPQISSVTALFVSRRANTFTSLNIITRLLEKKIFASHVAKTKKDMFCSARNANTVVKIFIIWMSVWRRTSWYHFNINNTQNDDLKPNIIF